MARGWEGVVIVVLVSVVEGGGDCGEWLVVVRGLRGCFCLGPRGVVIGLKGVRIVIVIRA